MENEKGDDATSRERDINETNEHDLTNTASLLAALIVNFFLCSEIFAIIALFSALIFNRFLFHFLAEVIERTTLSRAKHWCPIQNPTVSFLIF